jgi:hypothetical protein
MTRTEALAAGRQARLVAAAAERQRLEDAVLALWRRQPDLKHNLLRSAQRVVRHLGLDCQRVRSVRRLAAVVRNGHDGTDTRS